MNLRLNLLRHGETESGGGFRGSLGDALTVHGWAQMRTAVEDGRWDLLVSSPLQRCRAFAEELTQRQRIGLELGNDLRELHFGAWEGCSAVTLMDGHSEALGHFWADPYAFTSPGGESLSKLEARVLATQRYLRQHHAGRRVLLVTYGDIMHLLLARAHGLPRKRLLQTDVGRGTLSGLRVGEGDDRWHECQRGE